MFKKALLTSVLGGQIKIDGKRIPTAFSEENGLLELLRSSWTENAKVMVISGSPEDDDKNDSVLSCLKGSFELSGLSLSEILMCDGRNKAVIDRLPEMDAVILAGGHVPTQNAFMKKLRLKEGLQNWNGILIEDITYADSTVHEIIALNNGSYILIENGTETVCGEAYSIKDGIQKQICANGEKICLN